MSDPVAASSPPDLLGAVIADRYMVERRLGEGGMGQVFVARHLTLPREVAIKVLHPGMTHDKDAVARFQREAANAARIASPYVATVYDFGELPNGQLYLAMEFVHGQPLSDVLEANGHLPADRTVRIIRHVAEGLDVAHRLGIIHRDLKPDNILITTGGDGREMAKVVDFGISTAFEGENQKVTKTGMIAGTLEYMSPEQVSAGKLDQRSDIYSLALVAFVMLTGRNPFPGETAMMSMLKRLSDPPAPLRDMKPDVNWPDSLQRVFEQALSREPDLRYPSAPDFAEALGRAVEEWRAGVQGTMVMDGARPAAAAPGEVRTRVVGAAQGGAPTVTTPAPAPSRREAAAAPSARVGGFPLAALGAGVVILALAGFLASKLLGGGDAASAPPAIVATPTVQAPPPVDTAAVAGPTPAAPRAPVGLPAPAAGSGAAPASASAPAPTTSASGGGAAAAAARRQLERLDGLVDPTVESPNERELRGIITEVTMLLPRLGTRRDSALAYTVIAGAHGLLEEWRRGCQAIRAARDLRPDDAKLAERIGSYLPALCADPT